MCFCLSFGLPYHSDALPTTKHLILRPLWDQMIGDLLFGLLFLFSCIFPLLFLFLSSILCILFLLLQLELKVL